METKSTLAAVLVAPNQFEVQELPVPEIADDAALLAIEACGICGSDARIRRRVSGGPMIMGHENVGIIARIGRAASQRWRLQEGDRVALEEYVTCGACRWCRSELFRYCALTDGGLGGPPLRYGSTPVSVFPGLWGGYRQSAAAMAARAAGASCIIVAGLGVDTSRLEIARRIGAHYTVDVDQEDLVARVKEITGGDGVDVVINITGAGTNTVEQGLAAAAKVATVVISDAGKESISEVSFGRRELTLKSSNGHSYRSCERAIDMIASGEVDVEALSVPPYPLNKAAEAIDAVAGLIDRSITFASIVPTVGA